MSIQFEYQVPIWRSFIGVTFCCAFAIGVGYFAYVNQKGLRLYHLISLTPGQASALYWALASVLVLGTILFCILIARSIKGPIAISFEDTHLIAPSAAVRSKLLSIPYSSIRQVFVQKVGNQVSVSLHADVGKVTLMEMGFRSPQEFVRFKQILTTRMKG